MKKTALLSLLTAGAIVATTAGTFAAWDELTITTGSKTISIAQKAEVKAGTFEEFTPTSLTGVGDTVPEYTTTVSFDLATDGGRAKALTLKPIIMKDTTDVTANFNVEITQTGSDTGVTGFVDSKISEGLNEYNIKVTPKDATYAGQGVAVSIEATLS